MCEERYNGNKLMNECVNKGKLGVPALLFKKQIISVLSYVCISVQTKVFQRSAL